MNYLSLLLVATAALISVEAKIPDYIKICKRSDPQINKCIENSILSLKDKVVSGIPELEVPQLDPLTLDELILTLGSGVQAKAKNLLLTGGKEFQITNVAVDLDTDTFNFGVAFPKIEARGIYEIDAAIASIPLKGKGPMALSAISITGKGTLHGKKVVRGGKTLYYFPSMDLKLEMQDYTIKLENLFEGDASIGDATNKLLNSEKASVKASLIPAIEKVVIERILLVANNVCKHFTWDELFPQS